jgi:hypothetical protein
MGSFSAVHWVIFGIILFVLLKAAVPANTKPMICPTCGGQGKPVAKVRGSFWIEAILWLCLIVPGVIYSIWRLGSRHMTCPHCQAAGVIPLDTPRGQELIKRFAPEQKSAV